MAKAEDYGVELAHYLRFFNLSKKSVTISFLLVQTFPSFFCLCKRKKQRKAEPILMRDISFLNHFLGQNRHLVAALSQTLSVKYRAKRNESFLLKSKCRSRQPSVLFARVLVRSDLGRNRDH